MNQREVFFQTIKAFAGQQNTLVIPRELINFVQDINSALLLSQLIYWQDKGGKEGWIYKTYADWTEELSLTKYQVMKASEKLKKMGLLSTKVKKANGSPTVHYRLEWSVFTQSFVEFLTDGKSRNLTIESQETERSLTKITTEPTSKTTSIKDMYVVPIIDHLNQVCGTSYRATTPKTIEIIHTRMKEGFTVEDFMLVIDDRYAVWKDKPDMVDYLRPQTLFSNKFEGYLNSAHRKQQSAVRQPSAPDPDAASFIANINKASGGAM